jgi:hypothetical protein
MKSFSIAMLFCLLVGLVSGFQTPVPKASTTTALHVFGNKKSAAAKEEVNSQYWQGEWVCKDCGYIYNRVRDLGIESGCPTSKGKTFFAP